MNNIYKVLLGTLFAVILLISGVSCMNISVETGGNSGANWPHTFALKFGRGSYVTGGELYMPSGITAYYNSADVKTYVYVCTQDSIITKFDNDGIYKTRWQTTACHGIETDNNGNVYAAGLSQIKVYDPDGNFIRQWGSAGTGNGELRDTRDVAVNDILAPCDLCSANGKCGSYVSDECPNSKIGVVYVADSKNTRVQVFDTDGIYLFQWGSEGGGDGQFSGPRGPFGIAVDENPDYSYGPDPVYAVYVADSEKNRYQKFDQDGDFLLKWGGGGNQQGNIKWSRDVEVDNNGYVYECDGDAERIQVFDSDGGFIMEFQGLHNGIDGPFHPRSVAVDKNGNIFVAAAYAMRIDKFNPIDPLNPTSNFTVIGGNPGHPADGRTGIQGEGSENYAATFGWFEKGNGVLSTPGGIAIDTQNGYIYIADTGNFLIQKFKTDGAFLTSWGFSGRVWTIYTGGNDTGNFDFPKDIAVDGVGNVYVVRTGLDYGYDPYKIKRIQKFDKDGNFLTSWDHNEFDEGIKGIVYNPHNGYIYISNTPNDKIQYFETDGTYIGYFSFNSPGRIAVDRSNGNIYVADVNNYQVQKLDEVGNFLLKWGQYGTGNGEFKSVSGIYVDNNGYVYVADTLNRRIQVFDSNGNFNQKWGQWGSGDGEFLKPAGVVVDSDGYVYVPDAGKNNVQKFSPVQ